MFNKDKLKARLDQISAKTLILGGKQIARSRNERKSEYSEAFEHTPLEGPTSFRLIRICPGADTDVVSVDLFDADLDESPDFEALSYSWDLDQSFSLLKLDLVEDEKREERPILCNGETMHITMNLYHAFTEFRRSKKSAAIWADQVCINQQDGPEKVAQLAIMTRIYTSASLVIVWLGTLNPVRTWALDFMESLSDQPVPVEEVVEATAPQRSMFGQINHAIGAIASFSSSTGQATRWLGVQTILQRRWFQRAWTLQEFLLADRFIILMGHREVSQTAIMNAAAQFYDFFATNSLCVSMQFNPTSEGCKDAIQARSKLFQERTHHKAGKKYSAEEYLVRARTREATVPKDKVFAGSALLHGGVPTSVSYASSTREIYTAFAAERLWLEMGIPALSLVGGALPHVEGLPSWVPDLSTSMRPKPLRHSMCTTRRSSSDSIPAHYRIDGSILSLSTNEWASVSKIGESIWSWEGVKERAYNSDSNPSATDLDDFQVKMDTSTAPRQEKFGLMFALLDDLGETYAPTGERLIDALWNTLIGGVAAQSEQDMKEWQARFYQFFAFTYLVTTSNLKFEKSSKNAKPSVVSMIQDLPHMEKRVDQFLDAHDRLIDESGNVKRPLQKVITELADHKWGADTEEEADGWQNMYRMLIAHCQGLQEYKLITEFAEVFKRVYDGRRTFVTDNGFLGISNEAVAPGDKVLRVDGADAPYIFRLVNGSEPSYRLVGEAYVHGFDRAESQDGFTSMKVI